MRSIRMVSPDVHRIAALLARLDDLCREGAEIRATLEATASQRPLWPPPRSVRQQFRKSSAPSDFLPTSAAEGLKS